MFFVRALVAGGLTSTVWASVHNLFVGNLNAPESLNSLEYDDETNGFRKVQTFAADGPHAWIQFDVSVSVDSLASDG